MFKIIFIGAILITAGIFAGVFVTIFILGWMIKKWDVVLFYDEQVKISTKKNLIATDAEG